MMSMVKSTRVIQRASLFLGWLFCLIIAEIQKKHQCGCGFATAAFLMSCVDMRFIVSG
jgi:hypothetical protein